MPETGIVQATSSVWQIVTLLVLVIVVILLAYFATRIISGQYTKAGKGRNIAVLERVPLGRDAALVLARIGERYFALGVTAQGISSIAELDAEALDLGQGSASPAWFAMGRKKDAEAPPKDKPFSLYLHSMRDLVENKDKDEDKKE